MSTVPDLITAAAAVQIDLIAVTDHNTIRDISAFKALSNEKDVALVNGVELSAFLRAGNEVHILGYGLDHGRQDLKNICDTIMANRRQRNAEIVRRLNARGIDISVDDIEAYGSDAGRMAFARQMVARGYVTSIADAFNKYLARGCSCYVPYESVPLREQIELLSKMNGHPVLAHPFRVGLDDTQLYPFIKALKSYGLEGLEVYYPDHTDRQRDILLNICKKLDLAPTCGSDCHDGLGMNNIGCTSLSALHDRSLLVFIESLVII